MTHTDDTSPAFIAYDIDDLFNALPTFLGFRPEESLVAVATHGPHRRLGFRLRADIPDPADVGQAADVIVHHLRNHGAEGVIVLALTERQDVAHDLLEAIEDRLEEIVPIVISRSDGARYWVDVPGFPREGIAYETSDHHVSIVSAIAAGQEILPNREALAQRVAPPTGDRVDELIAVYGTVWPEVLDLMDRHPNLVETALDDLALVLRRIESGGQLDDEQTVRLCVWLSAVQVRDAIWRRIGEDSDGRWLHVLCHCSRHALDTFVPSVLSLTAFTAWLHGHGALALMANDRALSADPQDSLCRLMQQVLDNGIAPPSWQQPRERRKAG